MASCIFEIAICLAEKCRREPRPTQFFCKEYTYALIDMRGIKGFTSKPQTRPPISFPYSKSWWCQASCLAPKQVFSAGWKFCGTSCKCATGNRNCFCLRRKAPCRTTSSITECVPTAAVRTFILPSGKAWLNGASCICGAYDRISAETATIDSTCVHRHKMKWTPKHKQALPEEMHKEISSTASAG
jgi:hypothetical protein